ncbi:hypothetical protein [Microlunatus speluncae]|uniref:hypothetical protein n=1 Tax=Microlunatus speluncae TaxID=2594267 RepID=UPI0012663CFD|nr:hypothetical protein [Microlunatus speluncae]
MALAAQPWQDQVDLKVIDADRFAADPRSAEVTPAQRIRVGYDAATTHPGPGRRESLLVLATYFDHGYFDGRDPAELRKPVGRLCSVLTALITGAVPQSATEALRLLGDDSRLTGELRDLRTALDQLPDGSTVTEALSRRVQQAASDVADVLDIHVARGLLGPSCSAAGQQALAQRRARGQQPGNGSGARDNGPESQRR